MRDGVADVLAQRAALDRGAGAGIVVSLLLHGGLTALAVYAAMHAAPPQVANAINIQFMNVPAAAAPAAPRAATKPAQAKPVEAPPVIEEPKPPRIEEPKQIVAEAPKNVEKNTVPLSPFGKSPKKGSETPPAKQIETPPPALPGVPGTTTDVPVGGSGVTGLEGGDFPYTLYIQGMQRRIGANWFRPEMTGGAATVIYFRIQRNGTISEATIETSSGNGTFDRAALSAVRSSNPLTPLPFAYSGTYLGVHLTFR